MRVALILLHTILSGLMVCATLSKTDTKKPSKSHQEPEVSRVGNLHTKTTTCILKVVVVVVMGVGSRKLSFRQH